MSDQGVEKCTVGPGRATDRPQADIPSTPTDLSGLVQLIAEAIVLQIRIEEDEKRSAH
jgi:hypothetical protein